MGATQVLVAVGQDVRQPVGEGEGQRQHGRHHVRVEREHGDAEARGDGDLAITGVV